MSAEIDDLIHEQAKEIVSLREELTQVYAELDAKQKRKVKRAPSASVGIWPIYLMLVWWYFFYPARIRQFAKKELRRAKSRTLWELTAFMLYTPLLLTVLGFLVGSMASAVAIGVRLGASWLMLISIGVAWLRTAEFTKDDVDTGRQASNAVLVSSAIVALTISVIRWRPSATPAVCWVLVLPGFISVLNYFLLVRIGGVIGGTFMFRTNIFHSGSIPLGILLASGIVTSGFIKDTSVVMLVWLPLTLISASLMVLTVEIVNNLLAFEFSWTVSNAGRVNFSVRNLWQSIFLLTLISVYVVLIGGTLLGGILLP